MDFKPGDIVRIINVQGISKRIKAKKGALATVQDPAYSSSTKKYVRIIWIRNGDDMGEDDGNWRSDRWEVVKDQPPMSGKPKALKQATPEQIWKAIEEIAKGS